MKAIVFFRAAAVTLVIFAALHTMGFLGFVPPTAEGVAVRDAMNAVHFTVKGATYSYGNFYRGFGLFLTAAFLFEAFLAWMLGGMSRRGERGAVSIGAALALLQLAGAGIAWRYFGVPQIAFCVLVGVLAGAGAVLARREATTV